MAKISFLLATLCGLVSISLADPTMYGATPTKYPAPTTYSAPTTYPAPTTAYPAPTTTYPAPTKYETPTTTAKYEAPKYEKKKEEYPMKMEYGGKKYKRSVDDKKEEIKEETQEDPVKVAKKAGKVKLSKKNIQLLRDAVIESLLSDRRDYFTGRGSLIYGRDGSYKVRRGSYYGDIFGDPSDSLADIRFPYLQAPWTAPLFDDEDDSGLMMDDDQFFDMD